MRNARRWLGFLLLAFLLNLLVFPLWQRIQPAYCAGLVRLTEGFLKFSEYPKLTERLEFDGVRVRIYGVRQEEPYGNWEEIRFPFYLPFLLLLIWILPGVPLRDRVVLMIGCLFFLTLLHTALIAVVVKQTHWQFYAGKGVQMAGPVGILVLRWLKRLLFDFGKQAFSGGLVLLLLLRYRPGQEHVLPVSSPLGWSHLKPVAVGSVSLLVVGLLWVGIQRPIKRTHPWYEDFHLDLGKASLLEGRYPSAVRAFREALAVNPTEALTHFHLGVALGRQGHWEEAEASFRKSLSLDPDAPLTSRDLGWALLRLGRECEALTFFLRVMGIPDLPGGGVPDELIARLSRECGQGGTRDARPP